MVWHPGNALADTLGHPSLDPRPGLALSSGDPDPAAVLDTALGRIRRIDLDVHVLLQFGEPLVGARLFAAAFIFDKPAGTQNQRELLDDGSVHSGLLDGETDVGDPKLSGIRTRRIFADQIGPRCVDDFPVHGDRIRQIPGNHARLAVAIGYAAVLDRDALDAAGKIERPGNGIGIGCVDPPDDFHLRSSEVLVPAEPLEDAESELGITIPDFRAGRVGAFGEQIFMLFLFDLLPIFHNLALDHALNAEAGAERPTTFLHRQAGVVEYRRSRVPEFRRSPAWPRQTVIIPADFGIVLRCPQGDQVELCLVLHVGFEALRRLTAISGRPPAAINLAQNVLSRYRAVLHLDVLEHLVGEAELLREHVHHIVVILRFENRLCDLLAPLQGTVGCGTGAVHLKAC